jgi:uncharacterized protein YyaL (SSP411 family)
MKEDYGGLNMKITHFFKKKSQQTKRGFAYYILDTVDPSKSRHIGWTLWIINHLQKEKIKVKPVKVSIGVITCEQCHDVTNDFITSCRQRVKL